MPRGVGVSGLESDGHDQLFCGEERAGGSGRPGGLGEAARGAAALTAPWAHERDW